MSLSRVKSQAAFIVDQGKLSTVVESTQDSAVTMTDGEYQQRCSDTYMKVVNLVLSDSTFLDDIQASLGDAVIDP